jgi:hypothetical protein
MTRIFMVASLTVAMSGFALSQARNKNAVPSQTETELIALSQKAVDASIGKEIVVVEDAALKTPFGMMGNATVKGKFDAVELADTKTHIDGDLAVVTGRVVFKGGLPELQTKESSSSVTIRFSRRKGQWEFVGLCMGKCAAE